MLVILCRGSCDICICLHKYTVILQFYLTFQQEDENRVKQVEERRVIYIGRISEGTTKAELRTRFEKYGTIVDISVHFREHGYVYACYHSYSCMCIMAMLKV